MPKTKKNTTQYTRTKKQRRRKKTHTHKKTQYKPHRSQKTKHSKIKGGTRNSSANTSIHTPSTTLAAINKSDKKHITTIQKDTSMYKKYQQNRDLDPTHNPEMRKDRCQCVNYELATNSEGVETLEMKKCTAYVKPGTDFCENHQDCPSFLQQFTSGSEPEYNPKDWSHPYVEGSHNCYAYFLDDRKDSIKDKCKEICLKNNKRGCPKKDSECRDLIPQPGDHFLMTKYGNLDKKTRKYSCPNMHSRILADNPQIKPSSLTEKCPAGYYKGAMVVDPGHTFHFYRQNPDGTWSHKPGVLPVTNKDASGRRIYVPHFADRDYTQGKKDGDIKYDDFCGYYCIPKGEHIRVNMS